MTDTDSKATQGFETVALHGGQVPDPTTDARAVPIYQTTSYQFNSAEHAANLFGLKEFGNIYTRLMNPTTDVLEKRVAAARRRHRRPGGRPGQCGDHARPCSTSPRPATKSCRADNLYGGTYNLFHYTFPRFGHHGAVRRSDRSGENFRERSRRETKAVYAESIGNPKLDIAGPRGHRRVAHAAGIPFVLDNTVSARTCCRPFDYGVGHRRLLADQVHRRPRHVDSAASIVDSGKFDWTTASSR